MKKKETEEDEEKKEEAIAPKGDWEVDITQSNRPRPRRKTTTNPRNMLRRICPQTSTVDIRTTVTASTPTAKAIPHGKMIIQRVDDVYDSESSDDDPDDSEDNRSFMGVK